jgi:hypothetical protein
MRWSIIASAIAAVAGAIVVNGGAIRGAAAGPARSGLQRAGAAALFAGRLAEAEALYQQALAEPGPTAPIWFDLCLVRYAAGDYGRAINACYRALDGDEARVLRLLERIAAAMSDAGISASGVVLPEPVRAWFEPEQWLGAALAATAPRRSVTPETADAAPQPAEGPPGPADAPPRPADAPPRPADAPPAPADAPPAPADAPPMRADAAVGAAADPARAPSAFDVIGPDQLDRLRGPAPPLPYAVPAPADDYGAGYDVSPRTGVLLYAPDTSPLVAGARVELRRRDWGSPGHTYYFGEYLHAVDGTGGIGAVGVGARVGLTGGIVSGSAGLAVPWGRSEGRRDVLIRDHTLGLHGEVRFGLHHEVMISRSRSVSFEGTLIAGLNLGKALIRFGDALGDLCADDDSDCGPDTPDANPSWPIGHVMLQLGVSFGWRGSHAPYARSEVFAPAGGP